MIEGEKTELNGLRSAYKTHAMQKNDHLSEVSFFFIQNYFRHLGWDFDHLFL